MTEGSATATTFNVVYTLTNDDLNDANNPAISGSLLIQSGSGNDINLSSTTYAFEGGAASPDSSTRSFSVTAVDDALVEGSETVVLGLSAGGASTNNTFTITVTDNDVPPPPPNDNLAAAIAITANGAAVTGSTVNATLESNEALPICRTSATNSIWWSYTPSASGIASFSTDGSTATGSTVPDSYDTVLSVHTGTGHPLAQVGCDDDGGDSNTSLISSLSVTAGTTYYVRVGGYLAETGTVVLRVTGPETVTQTLSDVAGYRLLSTPVPGVTVNALADVNLVQGIAGAAQGSPNEAQYPTAQPNLFTSYTPGATGTNVFGSYTRPTSTATVVAPGRGFFWQFYDADINPADDMSGGGTSESYALPARQLTATGTPITADHSVAFTTATSDRFYMIGNPFARPLTVSAITVTGGVQGNVFQAYQPTSGGSGTYVLLSRTAGGGQLAAAVWQGFFAETVTTAAPTFLFDADLAVPTAPTFIGRPTVSAGIALRLSGLTAASEPTVDEAALIRFDADATSGWDALDASKLTPPAGPYALLAPVLDRDGAPYRVAISALPADAAEAYVPLAFTATAAGTYTVEADLSGLPEGWTATLRDLTTGAIVDLAAGHTFTADATDWTDRFVLHVTNGTVVSTEPTAPAAFALAAPAPNPTSSSATVAFDVPEASDVSVAVYDLLGRRVAVLAQGQRAPGHHTARMEAGAFAPGVYVVRMEAGTFSATRRVTVVR